LSDDPAVQQIYDHWGNRASLTEPDQVYETERIFKVGGYSITVPNDPTQPAKVASLYNRWGRSENPMPNMSFSEGEMRIPIEDFVDLILRRIPADELADGLMRDKTVRAQFIDVMASRYAGVMEDDDRRVFLHKVQETVYAVAIDRAIERLNSVETGHRSRDDYYRFKVVELGHYRGIYRAALELIGDDEEKLRRFASMHIHPDKLDEYIKGNRDPAAVESVGQSWHESRDFWRKRLEETFPEPTSEKAESHDH
jgi:hypothetical protein